jgi:hypothetical protein
VSSLIGVCELCGDEVRDYLRGRYPKDTYTCGRCGRWVCGGCGGHTPGLEDERKYGQVCKECYYELKADDAARWEAEFGAEERARGMENPHDLSEEEEEWRRHMQEYKAWRDSRDRET